MKQISAALNCIAIRSVQSEKSITWALPPITPATEKSVWPLSSKKRSEILE